MYCNRLGISTIHNALEEKWFSTTPFFERWYNVMGAKEALVVRTSCFIIFLSCDSRKRKW